ncbi:universal stress protein [Nodosilinea nodulosa]|uniref:universal stress protein n=1 Tax=Nodosilinea nodulosa TaxID=416001 RepID=UPI0002FD2A20|nr:universal stress protein [Nodosilinea nodulosa]
MLNKIVVATINLDASSTIFDHALMLAKATGAHLGILYVTDSDEVNEDLPAYLESLEPFLSGDGIDPFCYVGQFEALEPDRFGALVKKAVSEGVTTDCIHCFGNPEMAINEFAAAWNADLIVLGRRGRSAAAELFFGSVSNFTLHNAPCSVYIVHESHRANPENAVEQTAGLST